MGEHEDLIEAGREAERYLAALTAEQNLEAAQVARDAKPRLRTARLRQIAEETALRFEARAAALKHRRPIPRSPQS